jgi:hypothetical protein
MVSIFLPFFCGRNQPEGHMEAGQIIVVLVLVLAVPIAFAWAQSRWEISRERRAARTSRPITPTAAPDARDPSVSAQDGIDSSA